MLYQYSIEELIGLQDINVTKIEKTDKFNNIHLELKKKENICPCCGNATSKIHDYRIQKVKDIPSFGYFTLIYLRKRRYRCNKCNKRFFENNSFLPKYKRITNRLSAKVINDLASANSFYEVAKSVNLTAPTVIRIFDNISYPKATLNNAIAIDEFKGNANNEKYHCIITDPIQRTVLDILPKRYDYYLSSYFSKYPKETRQNIKLFVSDMWKPYFTTCTTYFPNATSVIDKFHWVRQIIWAFEKVRKEEQKYLSKDLRIYFKKSKSLLLKRFNKLKDEEKQQVNVMLSISVNLSRAYYYKEYLFRILDTQSVSLKKQLLKDFIIETRTCNIKSFEYASNTLYNWLPGILNSFDSIYTNAFTEGCNNKIKVLKRNAYGYRNFNRFRNRILHMFSYLNSNKNEQVA